MQVIHGILLIRPSNVSFERHKEEENLHAINRVRDIHQESNFSWPCLLEIAESLRFSNEPAFIEVFPDVIAEDGVFEV